MSSNNNNAHNLPMYSEPSHEYEYPDDDYQYPTEAELDGQNIDIYVNSNNVDYYDHMNRMYAIVFDQLVQAGVIIPNSQVIDQIEPNIIQPIAPALPDNLDHLHHHQPHHQLGDDIDRHIDQAMHEQPDQQSGDDIEDHIQEALMDYFNRHEPR